MKEQDEKTQLPSWVYILLVVLVAFFCCRYGWKLFGFSQCGAGFHIEQVEVASESVRIKGYSNQSLGAFVGYKTEQIGNVLYVGFKQNTILGVLPTDSGSFDYNIPTVGTVEKVVLRGGDTSTVIWGEENLDQMTVRVRVKGVLLEEVEYTVYYDEKAIAKGTITLTNQNDFVLPFVFQRADFEENADMQKLALSFVFKGAEGELAVPGRFYPGIDFGEETEIVLEPPFEE